MQQPVILKFEGFFNLTISHEPQKGEGVSMSTNHVESYAKRRIRAVVVGEGKGRESTQSAYNLNFYLSATQLIRYNK